MFAASTKSDEIMRTGESLGSVIADNEKLAIGIISGIGNKNARFDL